MKNKTIMLTIFMGGVLSGASALHGAAEGGKITREDKFNNQNQDGVWSMLSLAIEGGNLEYVQLVVPSRIERNQRRNFPGARSDNLTAYDIAKFHLDNNPAFAGGPARIKMQEIVDYLNPAHAHIPGGPAFEVEEEAKGLAAKPAVPGLEEQVNNFVRLIRLSAEKNDISLMSTACHFFDGLDARDYPAKPQHYTGMEIATVILPVLQQAIVTGNHILVSSILSSGLIVGQNLEQARRTFNAFYSDAQVKGNVRLIKMRNYLGLSVETSESLEAQAREKEELAESESVALAYGGDPRGWIRINQLKTEAAALRARAQELRAQGK